MSPSVEFVALEEFLSAQESPTPLAEGAAGETRAGRKPRPQRDNRDHGRARRRQNPIPGSIGPNGSGKTAAMVFDTLPTLDGQGWECRVMDHAHCDPIRDDQGNPVAYGPKAVFSGVRRVLSTITLYDTETGQPHPLYDRFTDWPQLLNAEHTDVLMDEIMGVASSRDNSLPKEIERHLHKLRHWDVTLRWTSPSWARAEILVREVTQAVTDCRGHFPNFAIRDTAWVPKRLFNWRTFPTVDFEEFTSGRRDKMGRAKPRAWVWGPGSRFFAAYDTMGAVTMVGPKAHSGICIACNGRRTVPLCKCEH